MAFLDFIKEHAQSVQNLPENVKAQAVEAAKPIAEIAGKGAVPQDAPVQPQSAPTPGRGRSLGWER